MKWTAMALVIALTAGSAPRALAADCAPLGAADEKCQQTIGKAGGLYAKLALKAIQGCLLSFQKGKITGPDATSVCVGTLATPPTDAKTAQKLTDAAAKANKKIGTKCLDSNVAALDLCAATVAGLGTCLIDEHQALVLDAVEAEAGMLVASTDAGVQKCQKSIVKEAGKLLLAKQKALQGCLKDRNKACGTTDPLPHCLTSTDSGPKAEQKTRSKIDKALLKMTSKITAGCTASQVAALDACASDVAGVIACLACTHGNGADDMVADEYKVVNGATPAGTLQAAADAAEDGDTIIMQPGAYSEAVVLKDSGLTVLGHKDCSTGARAVLDDGGVGLNGIYACGSRLTGCPDEADDLVMQGFEANNYQDNDIYIVGAEGVTFRDLVTKGPGIAGGTKYGPFPILSHNVLIENCLAEGIADAAIYVGQSIDIVVRNNEVRNSVAGLEIENSANAEVYGNHAHDNAGGLLVFKLPGLPQQLSQCHYFHDNLSENNNGPNYGVGTVGLVPSGTGMIVLSDDTTVFQNNTLINNNSFGISVVDQFILNSVFPGAFPSLSPEYLVDDNRFVGNTITGNGGSPDPAIIGFEADVTYVTIGSQPNPNPPPPNLTQIPSCQNGNTYATTVGNFATLGACPNPPYPVPGCPYVVVPTTTSTSTTTPTTSTSTSTTLPSTFTDIYNNVFVPAGCVGCHPAVYPALDLSTKAIAYASLVNVAASELPTMDRVEPGSPGSSYLQYKIDGNQGTLTCPSLPGCGSQMPLAGTPLDAATRGAIAAWITGGAPND